MDTANQIKEFLESQLTDAKVFVSDPYHDNTHLEAIVISEAFEGLSLLEQHKTVMKLLKGAFSTYLHALKLKTYTQKAWEKINQG